MAFIQRLGQLRSPVSTYSNLPITGNVLGDVRIVTDTGDAYTWMITSSNGSLSNWQKVTSSSYNDLVGSPSASALDVDNAVKTITSLSINFAYLSFNMLQWMAATIFKMVDGVVDNFRNEAGVEFEACTSAQYVSYEEPGQDPSQFWFAPDGGELDVYTKLLLHGDGVQGSTDFQDLARLQFINHGVTVDTVNKKFGTGSLSFNGSTYFQIDNPPWTLDLRYSSPFSLDFWFYSLASGVQPLFSSTPEETILVEKNSSNKIHVQIVTDGVTYSIVSTSSISNSVWNHIAIQRDADGYLNLYINGVLEATSTGNDTNPVDYATSVVFGKHTTTYLTGNLDEIRFCNGVVKFSSNFTPRTRAYNKSTTPVPTPTIVDISAGAKTVTPLGNARMSGNNPLFGNASLYLDGINSYLSLADSDDWKLSILGVESYGPELVVNGNFDSNVDNWTASPGWGRLVLNTNGYSGNCLETNHLDSSYSWAISNPISVEVGKTYELSVQYNNVNCNGCYIFLGQTFNGQEYGIGEFLHGNTWTNKTITVVATTPIMYINLLSDVSARVGLYGFFDNVSLRRKSSALSDYTIDLWIDPLSLTDLDTYIIGQDDSWKLTLDGTSNKYLKFTIIDGASVIAPISLNLNTWQHVAVVQKDGVIKLYVNGVLGASVTGSAIENGVNNLTIGATSTGTNLFNGFIEEVRISKGIARWISAFTPPSVEYSSDSYTKLLLPLNIQTVPNMVLQSVGYVSNYVPTSARVVIFEEDIDDIEPNVNLVIEVSRDGGTTFSNVIIAKDQEFGDGTLNLFSGSVDLSSQPNGELMVWKLITQNNKDCRIRGISLNWR